MPRMQDEKLLALVNSAARLVQSDGSVPYGMLLRFQQTVYLLAHYGKVEGYNGNCPEKQQFLCKVLRELAGRENISKDQFVEAIESELQRRSERREQQYTVLFSVRMDRAAAELLSLGFGLCPGAVEHGLLDAAEAQKAYNIYGYIPAATPDDYRSHIDRYAYYAITQESVIVDDAIEAARVDFDLARAWVNFALCMFAARPNSEQRSLAKCAPSCLINCYDEHDQLVAQRHASANYVPGMPILREGDVARARRFLEHALSRPKTIVMDRMKSAVTLYGEAMDTPDEAYRFFHLWQALEILLGTGDQNEMRARMKSLLPAKDISAALIEPLIDKRNRLIYLGRVKDFSEEDTGMLKNLVDNTLVSILALSEKLRTNKQIEDFWDFWGLHEDELKRKRAVLDQILSTPKYAA